MDTVTDAAKVLALTKVWTGPWYELSEVLEDAGDVEAVVAGSYRSYDERLTSLASEARTEISARDLSHWQEVLDTVLATRPGTRMVSVLDDEYPENLRRIYNRPPFLFISGSLQPVDDRSIAIVGTRKASERGMKYAERLARELAQRDVTVISGMAAGIDTAAHRAALEAGGRTVAVMGTGIDKVYPAANRELAGEIPLSGALISQFWPGAPPRRQNFPLRNVVTSGMAFGTVVIEASHTSGAKMQGRLALEHGKRLFLLRSLVMQEEWAQRYSMRPGAVVVNSVDDVLEALDAQHEQSDQLALF